MYRIYQISNDDTLDSIAEKFNTTIENIRELNGINGDVLLRAGGFIIVPTNNAQNGYTKTYIVKKDDTIYMIARKNNIDPKMLLELNGLENDDYIYPGQEIIIPRNNMRIYKIEDGDSIKSIEAKTGVNINEIKTPNGELYLKEDQIIMY